MKKFIAITSLYFCICSLFMMGVYAVDENADNIVFPALSLSPLPVEEGADNNEFPTPCSSPSSSVTTAAIDEFYKEALSHSIDYHIKGMYTPEKHDSPQPCEDSSVEIDKKREKKLDV